ncbi:MAG: BA14K family protein [Pseudomonadota bacterium]
MYSTALKSLVVAALGAAVFMTTIDTASARDGRCHREAKRYADSRIDRGESALGTAVGGAAIGAIIGGVLGGGKGAGKGAIIGGSTGAVGSAVGTAGPWQRHYDRAYDDCIDQYEPVRAPIRDEPVRRYADDAIEPWTDEWFDYCRARYRSFNARSGTYTGYDGIKYFCQAQ